MIPQWLFTLYRRYYRRSGWFGDYQDWKSADVDCSGYDGDAIFERVKGAVLKVKNGEAAFERDGIAFLDSEPDSVVVGALEQIFEGVGNRCLHVLDFGGSLGSTYYQNKPYLAGKIGRWTVVEQGHFVNFGKARLEDDVLKFEYNINDIVGNFKPDVIVLNSVLQYLEDPENWIKEFAKSGVKYLLFTHSYFIDSNRNRITKQIVSPKIYVATYPCWIFSSDVVRELLGKYYKILSVSEKEEYGYHQIGGCRIYQQHFLLNQSKENINK
jgi:putative methyltransferase (TIGR04325 family)